MPSSRKTRRKIEASSSSESDDELVNEFFREGKKIEKTVKVEPTVPAYVTRSGRKIIPKFGKLSLHKGMKKEDTTDSSEEESDDSNEVENPALLYEDDQAIESSLFGFQTPKRKQSMMTKAADSVTKIQGGTETSKRQTSGGKKLKGKEVKTPKATRSQFKRKISREAAKQTMKIDESNSDYEPSASESDSSESDDPVPLEDVDDTPRVQETEPEPTVRRSTRNQKADTNFIFTSDDYFERQNTRSITSNHNLNKLKNPRMQHDQLMSLLQDLNTKHKEAYRELDADNKAMFKKWLIAMSQGFNVLLYGVGSKRTLLNAFYSKYLASSPTLIVNGFFPGVTVKDILDSLILNVLKMKTAPAQPHEAVECIAAKLKPVRQPDVFVIIHNLDGPALCVEKVQATLAGLAAIPKVNLLASIDHINAPLLWDQNKLGQFNFIWEDATSFLPYFEETSFESSLMVQRSGAMALSSLRNVFQSLTANARKVFSILLKHQLKNQSKHYQGMLFSELYRSCRSTFIVSSDLALRTQLTEFFDHKLVKHKKETDQLYIQVESNVLKQFSDELGED